MSKEVYLIISAGGRGVRMGAKEPKQFLTLGGKTILQRSIEKFIAAVPDIHVVTVLPSGYADKWKEICLASNFIVRQKIVTGGITRFHSVKNALAQVPDGVAVMVHDGVRPLLSSAFVRKMLDRFEDENLHALIPVLPSVDSLKSLELKDGKLSRTGEPDPERSLVWRAQTPQLFRSEELREAYSQAYSTSFTDDASVAEANKIPLAWIEGERFNIKITTPEDLALADFLARNR